MVNAFEVAPSFADELFLKSFRIHDRAFDDHAVGHDRHKHIVEHRECTEYAFGIQRTGQIEQNDIRWFRIVFEKSECVGMGAFRIALQNGIGFTAR